jgi:hypothetical protein
MIKSLFIYFIIFALYLEFNPALGNIWYRTGEDGLKHLQLQNLFYFILEPLHKPFLWKFEYLDLNFFVGAFIISLY